MRIKSAFYIDPRKYNIFISYSSIKCLFFIVITAVCDVEWIKCSEKRENEVNSGNFFYKVCKNAVYVSQMMCRGIHGLNALKEKKRGKNVG